MTPLFYVLYIPGSKCLQRITMLTQYKRPPAMLKVATAYPISLLMYAPLSFSKAVGFSRDDHC